MNKSNESDLIKQLSQLPRSKSEAQALGLPLYYTGKRCKTCRQHSERCAHIQVSCCSCLKERRAETAISKDYAPKGAESLLSGSYYKVAKFGRVFRYGAAGWVKSQRPAEQIIYDVGYRQPQYWSHDSD